MTKRRSTTSMPDNDSSVASKNARGPTLKISEDKYTSIACNVVLETTELLERVLAHLSPEKIFELQRVSQHWKQAISVSPEIQELLFLRAAPPGRTRETWEAFDAKTQQRIRIHFAYPCGLDRHQLTTRRISHTQDDANSDYPVLFLSVALNPLMERHPWSFPLPRPLMDLSEQGDSYRDAAHMRERVRYKGTMASLEQYPRM
ncbi:hypothetical protein MBLNU13_g02909t1 [Cladosporium sp. NU13]